MVAISMEATPATPANPHNHDHYQFTVVIHLSYRAFELIIIPKCRYCSTSPAVSSLDNRAAIVAVQQLKLELEFSYLQHNGSKYESLQYGSKYKHQYCGSTP
ncbi:hypothetical protein BG011_004111 [Mortierella polycephala]|uniref:Uncharacterized protein n=1 Tax=Mortierella polycephala TaxID=41804 RepID=A0A9P6QH23_9FUNG|nr:hypothetical protein BG011_004111 [Mortierella polycephala]